MTWFFAFLIVALMGVVAVVASGRGGWMADAYDDRPDSRVQADGPLTATDLRQVRFSTAFRGYRMSEVDALLDRLAEELSPPATEATDTRESVGWPAYAEVASDGNATESTEQGSGGGGDTDVDADIEAAGDTDIDAQREAQAEDSRS